MALGTLRDRGTENEKRAVDGMMERGNFSWATVCVVIQTATDRVPCSLEKMQTAAVNKMSDGQDAVDDGGM